jgi:2-keto-4-pentenoate hydratase/2-oxohepta-3-ene-1,7-dioic acid hydratase in catechol pathway
MVEFMEQGEQGKKRLEAMLALFDQGKIENTVYQEEDIEFLPVVQHPSKILCVGLNYRAHVAEAQHDMPTLPVIFSKSQNALTGHRANIPYVSSVLKYDYEAELVIVIGKPATNVSEEDALSYVVGYTAGNDVSARELQKRTSQWHLGKSLDGFGPVGPYLVTSDTIDPQDLSIVCRVNGEVRQQARTSAMLFSCSYLIHYLSSFMTLQPGDLIFTGTPEGVIMGYPSEQQVWLQAGDTIEVEIEKIGVLRNTLKN